VLWRSASVLALLAVIAAPAVTSTRLFCRYTGEEIIGCAETAPPEQPLVRAECCQHRTFHALDGVRPVHEQRQETPAPVAVDLARVPLADRFALAAPRPRGTAAPSAGPPAFITHRALLI